MLIAYINALSIMLVRQALVSRDLAEALERSTATVIKCDGVIKQLVEQLEAE